MKIFSPNTLTTSLIFLKNSFSRVSIGTRASTGPFYSGKILGLKFISNQSDLLWFIPKSVSEPIRIHPSQSEKIRFNLVSCNSVKNQSDSIRDLKFDRNEVLNPNESNLNWIPNPNNSDLGFSLGLSRIVFPPIFIKRDWIFFSDWLGYRFPKESGVLRREIQSEPFRALPR